MHPKVIAEKQNPMIARVPKSVIKAKNCCGVTVGQAGLAAALPSPDSEDAVDPEILHSFRTRLGG